MNGTRFEPAHEEEVGRFLADASREGGRVRVEGTGSRLPSPVGEPEPAHRVSAAVLQGIHSYEPEDLVMTVGAGTTLGRVREVAESEGQWVALDPPGGRQRSVGGAVAGGEYGPVHAGMGGPREQLLAARLVTGDGRRLGLGAPVVKNVAGYDLVKLLPGSRGRLGLVTSVTLRLHPRPPAERTLLFQGSDPMEGAGTARRLAAAPIPITACELLVRCPESGGVDTVVAVRLTGRGAALDSLQETLETVAAMPASRVLADEESRKFFREMEEREGEAGPPIVMSTRPTQLAEAVAAVENGTWGDAPVIRGHVLGGRLRVFPQRPSDGLGEEPGPHRWEAGTSSSSLGVARLVEGLRRVFDPQGTLVDPGPPWREVTP